MSGPSHTVLSEAFSAPPQLAPNTDNKAALFAARRLVLKALGELTAAIDDEFTYDRAWVAEGHLTDALEAARAYLRSRR